MPFITQGKTNLTYILIVVVLAAVVGGGILGYQYWYLPKEETRPKEFPYQVPAKKTVNIKVTNSVTNQPVTGAKIIIESYHDCSPTQVIGNECMPELWNLETNINGEATFDKLGAPLNMQVTAEKNGFQTISKQVIDDEFTIEESSTELLFSLPPKEVPAAETADWKTYESSKMGFSIKYPLEWIISEEEYVEDEGFKGFKIEISTESLENGYDTCIVYIVLGKIYSEEKKELTFKEAIDEVRREYSEDPQITVLKEEETVLDGVPAIKFSSSYSWEGRGIDIFAPWKDEIFYILLYEFSATEPETKFRCEPVFNQILSTFKFLD